MSFWKERGLGSGLRTLPQGFLSPTRGTEGGVKTIGKGLGESGGASLKGKGGRVGFRKILIDFIKVAKNIVIIHQLP